jgi:Domain of unknown function (DUF4124)
MCEELTGGDPQSTIFEMRWLVLLLLVPSVRADVYTYEDKEGVIHFTNVKPAAGGGQHWKVLYKSGPGKAGVISGAAGPTSFAGCAE